MSARRTRGIAGARRFPQIATRSAAVAVTALLGAAFALPTAASAGISRTAVHPAVAGNCQNPAAPGGRVTDIPWAQKLLDPQRVQSISNGAGVTIAVIDSGVDDSHPQLRGHVLTGHDYLGNGLGGNFDCSSHGTAVASLIVGQHVSGVGFQGLAPGASILPMRVSDHEDGSTGDSVGHAVFAQAIRDAADQGARIINISLTLDTDYPDVAAAVDYAVKTKGCLIVAAAGNKHSTATAVPPSIGATGTAHADKASYPAAYPGVLGVGAIDQSGARLAESQVGPFVDLVAPGGGVLAATRVSGYATWSGTSFAAPLVSAAAALLWSLNPRYSSTDVAWRLEASADRMPGPAHSAEFGYGLLDPYRALTELLPPSQAPSPAAAVPGLHPDPKTVARAARWHTAGRTALVVAVLAALLALVAWVLVVAVRRGRTRDWRPAPPAVRVRQPPVEEPEEVFFSLPKRGGPGR